MCRSFFCLILRDPYSVSESADGWGFICRGLGCLADFVRVYYCCWLLMFWYEYKTFYWANHRHIHLTWLAFARRTFWEFFWNPHHLCNFFVLVLSPIFQSEQTLPSAAIWIHLFCQNSIQIYQIRSLIDFFRISWIWKIQLCLMNFSDRLSTPQLISKLLDLFLWYFLGRTCQQVDTSKVNVWKPLLFFPLPNFLLLLLNRLFSGRCASRVHKAFP